MKIGKTIGSGGTIYNPLRLPDGTAAAPALAFSNDSNTGFFWVSTGGFRFSADGTAEIILSGAGSRGLGLSSTNVLGWSSGAIGSGNDLILARSAAGSLSLGGIGNGQLFGLKTLTELVTLVSGHATDATTIQLPANAIIMGVSVRVTVAPATTATFTVTGTSSATAFQTGANVSAAATTTDVGTKSCPYLNPTAQTITLTYNAAPTDSLGRVRVTIHYFDVTAAIS